MVLELEVFGKNENIQSTLMNNNISFTLKLNNEFNQTINII
jgi:hypothetical protein